MQKQDTTDSKHEWITVEKLRAGDIVDVKAEARNARVILVEQADPKHVLVAYEGFEQVDYHVGAKLRIRSRERSPRSARP